MMPMSASDLQMVISPDPGQLPSVEDAFAINSRDLSIPMVPVRGMVLYPDMMLHFDVGRPKSLKSLEEAMAGDQLIFLVAQKDAQQEEPGQGELYAMGTVAVIKQLLHLPGEPSRVMVEGRYRAQLLAMEPDEACWRARILPVDRGAEQPGDIQGQAGIRVLLDQLRAYAQLSSRVNAEAISAFEQIELPGRFADAVAAAVLTRLKDKQAILECIHPHERLELMIGIFTRELEIMEAERNIQVRVKEAVEKNQKEFFLREQIKAIQQELGEKDGAQRDVEEIRARMEGVDFLEEVREKIEGELDRMGRMPPMSPEGPLIRTYLEWLCDLPWNRFTTDRVDLKVAREILDENHYGLDKVKQRVLEYLAVVQLTQSLKGPILCFVGPPGVGKTSIAQSIAKALDRKFVRMSLGGVRDEAEIRGHRRTYVGAIPGRIIHGLKQAGSANPVFLFDEIDKLGNDFRGDPASALLEVLDAEQNHSFRDHYLEVPFDLSKVMFLTTANTLDTVPQALLDRMEVIRIEGYTEQEKLQIARRHLVAKQSRENGLAEQSFGLLPGALTRIIREYTREAGVRSLERSIASVCRKAARQVVEHPGKGVRVTAQNIEKYLGKPLYQEDPADQQDQAGLVNGLAWTRVGGVMLSVEATSMHGSGKLELTGQLGSVMRESARAALSCVRALAPGLGIGDEVFEKTDIHIHVPEGAVQKDGPSAGVTMATALVSALTGIPVRHDVAMTGEITLRGRVLPIGGLKEKSLAAHRLGMSTVIYPAANSKDLEEIPIEVRQRLDFKPVSNLNEALQIALTAMPKGVADAD
jgi:ATP-dependent Lon protease